MTLRHPALAALLCVALAAPAQALSCRPADPRTTFTEVAAAAAPFIVVTGRFSFDAAKLPEQHAASLAATFRGKGLTRKGFTTRLSMPVILDVTCAGPWCGSLAPDAPYLAFLERAPDGYRLSVDACPFYAFANPDAGTLAAMTACLADGGCKAP